MQETDIVIIGGGIVGLATAWHLTRQFPGHQLTLLEKEPRVASHQSSHNSGVLHSGIYYKPGSLRARNCVSGKRAMEAFCQEEGIPFERCGKVIVAIDESERPTLQRIFERGQANGVQCELIDRARLQELEPHAAGIAAIHVPEAGITDYHQVALRLAERVTQAGGNIVTGATVTALRRAPEGVMVITENEEFAAKWVVNCAGLFSDRVTALGGGASDVRIIPFRGEYYELKPEAQHLCRNLIYPVPDPRFPFLGVHFTRRIGGGIECGPNAVLAWAREGYRKTDVNLRDLMESLTWPGFVKLAARYWKTGAGEMWRSLSKGAFVRALQRLMPELKSSDLEPAPSGVRAQAVSRDGQLVDDFVIETGDRIINVCNAPSPAATSSLNIGQLVVDRLAPALESEARR